LVGKTGGGVPEVAGWLLLLRCACTASTGASTGVRSLLAAAAAAAAAGWESAQSRKRQDAIKQEPNKPGQKLDWV